MDLALCLGGPGGAADKHQPIGWVAERSAPEGDRGILLEAERAR